MEEICLMINYNIPGWMSDWELMWLHETAKTMNSVLEIGSFKGRSTYALCTACKGSVFAVDMFKSNPLFYNGPDFYEDFYKNVGHFENLVILRTDSLSASRFFRPKSIDMIFIDGDHSKTGVINDLTSWWRICNKLICGHDLRPWKNEEWTKGESEVKVALEELNINYEIAVDSIWKYEVRD